MNIIVDKDRYLYYKECEEALESIYRILHDKEFLSYYEKIQENEDVRDLWDDFVILIHNRAAIVKINKGKGKLNG